MRMFAFRVTLLALVTAAGAMAPSAAAAALVSPFGPVPAGPIAGTTQLYGVACPSTSLCLGVGNVSAESAGVAVPLNAANAEVPGGRGVQDITGTEDLTGVACPTGTVCLAVGGDGAAGVAVPLAPSTGLVESGQSVQDISGTGGLAGVACVSATLCLGVGGNGAGTGVAVPLDPATGAVASGQSAQDITGTFRLYRRGLRVGHALRGGGDYCRQRRSGRGGAARPRDRGGRQRPERPGHNRDRLPQRRGLPYVGPVPERGQ